MATNAFLGLSDNLTYSKVIVHRQTKNALRVEGGTGGKSFISVMFCASATGFLLPPFVVYKSKRLFQQWCVDGPPDTGYDTSERYVCSEMIDWPVAISMQQLRAQAWD